jgi:Fur family ferric uptake transcriptional regulator
MGMKKLPAGVSGAFYKDLLSRMGVKSTRQRLAVLEILGGSDRPMTAEELFLKIREDGAQELPAQAFENLSLSTVYRILDTLIKKSVVTKSGLMDGGKALFEMNSDVHRHNLICIKCHRIIPIEDCPLSEYECSLARQTGYQISGHKLEVYGICPKCKR